MEDDLLRRAGWQNYIEQTGHAGLSLEALAINLPDSVYYAAPASQSLAHLFARHPILEGRTKQVDNTGKDYWRWQCPGPWTHTLVEELAAW